MADTRDREEDTTYMSLDKEIPKGKKEVRDSKGDGTLDVPAVGEGSKEAPPAATGRSRAGARGTPVGGKAPMMVYIGPSFPGVRQYTVYNNGLPAVLEERIEKEPAFKSLAIPVEDLAGARKGLATGGSAIRMLYQRAEGYLSQERDERS